MDGSRAGYAAREGRSGCVIHTRPPSPPRVSPSKDAPPHFPLDLSRRTGSLSRRAWAHYRGLEMYIPKWVLAIALVIVLGLGAWSALVLTGRNPLPFPDMGSRIYSTASPEAKAAVVDILARHGVHERFQVNSDGVLRSIMMDGTIINHPTPEVMARVGGAAACIGLVARDPEASAREAAALLSARGFEAELVLDVEPGLPIAFVLTDALNGSCLNFRPHIINMPPP